LPGRLPGQLPAGAVLGITDYADFDWVRYEGYERK